MIKRINFKMKRFFVFSFVVFIWTFGAVAQTITSSPQYPVVLCPQSAGKVVATLTSSGFASGGLTSSWILSGNSTNFRLANPRVGSAQLVVGSTCSGSPGGVTASVTQPSGSGITANLTFPSGPLAEWILCSTCISGTTVADFSPLRNQPATVVGGPLTFGVMGANFNGTSQNLDNSTLSTTSWTAITVCAWFNATTIAGANPRLVANSFTNSDNAGFQLMFINSGSGGGGFFDVGNGSAEGRAQWGNQLVANQWYYYCGTYDNANVRAYLNGSQIASAAFSGALAVGTGPDIIVGRGTYGYDWFSGALFDIRIYNRALPAAEITGLYNGNTTPLAISFTTNPVSVQDTTTANTNVTNFSVVTPNGQTYPGIPTGACATQNPCPFTIGGSTGAWQVKTATNLNSSYDATNNQYTVTAP